MDVVTELVNDLEHGGLSTLGERRAAAKELRSFMAGLGLSIPKLLPALVKIGGGQVQRFGSEIVAPNRKAE